MTTADDRASNSARNDAIKLIDDALKSGRIVQADRDMRVDQIKSAQTMQDIALQVQDLQAPPPTAPPVVTPIPPMPGGQPPNVTMGGTPGGSPPGSTPGQWPLVNYGPGSAPHAAEFAQSVGKSGRAIGGIIVLIVVASIIVPIAGAIIAFVSARNSFPDIGAVGPSDDTTYLPGQTPGDNGVNVHTVDGYQALVDALKQETKQTFAYTTVIYPRYAVVEVPTGVNTRYQDFYWDGDTLSLNDSRGTTDGGQVDLSLVDPNQMITMLNTVRDRMDNPNAWYIVIDDLMGGAPEISAYASNDFGESTYLIEGLDGTVIYDSDPSAAPPTPSPPS